MKVRISEEHIRVRIDKNDSHLLENDEPVRCSIAIGDGSSLSFVLEADSSSLKSTSLELSGTQITIKANPADLVELISGSRSQISRGRTDDGCAITIEVDIQ